MKMFLGLLLASTFIYSMEGGAPARASRRLPSPILCGVLLGKVFVRFDGLSHVPKTFNGLLNSPVVEGYRSPRRGGFRWVACVSGQRLNK